MQQPFATQNERVVFTSVQNIAHEDGEITPDRSMALFSKLFEYVGSRNITSPDEYLELVYLVADEAWCGVDPIYRDFSPLPRVTDEEYEHFVGKAVAQREHFVSVALKHAGDQYTHEFACKVEALAVEADAQSTHHNVLRVVLET